LGGKSQKRSFFLKHKLASGEGRAGRPICEEGGVELFALKKRPWEPRKLKWPLYERGHFNLKGGGKEILWRRGVGVRLSFTQKNIVLQEGTHWCGGGGRIWKIWQRWRRSRRSEFPGVGFCPKKKEKGLNRGGGGGRFTLH